MTELEAMNTLQQAKDLLAKLRLTGGETENNKLIYRLIGKTREDITDIQRELAKSI